MDIKNKKITRRDFMRKAALTGAVAAASSGLHPALKAFAARETSYIPESGRWMPTTCQGCTSWCSVQAYVVDGAAECEDLGARGFLGAEATEPAGAPEDYLGHTGQGLNVIEHGGLVPEALVHRVGGGRPWHPPLRARTCGSGPCSPRRAWAAR